MLINIPRQAPVPGLHYGEIYLSACVHCPMDGPILIGGGIGASRASKDRVIALFIAAWMDGDGDGDGDGELELGFKQIVGVARSQDEWLGG